MKNYSKKVLVVDGMFPNKFSSWRNYEVIALMEEFGADVFVYKGTPWAGIDFQIDYGYIAQQTDLSEYCYVNSIHSFFSALQFKLNLIAFFEIVSFF